MAQINGTLPEGKASIGGGSVSRDEFDSGVFGFRAGNFREEHRAVGGATEKPTQRIVPAHDLAFAFIPLFVHNIPRANDFDAIRARKGMVPAPICTENSEASEARQPNKRPKAAGAAGGALDALSCFSMLEQRNSPCVNC